MGGVAQLGERLLCKQEVAGSNPVTSTIKEKSDETGVWGGNAEYQKVTTRIGAFMFGTPTCRTVSSLFVDRTLKSLNMMKMVGLLKRFST